MAVIYERLGDTDLIKAYSDTGHMLVNPDGVLYAEAIDPEYMNRTYEESDQMIDDGSDDEGGGEE